MKHKVLYGTYAKNPCAYCRLKRVSLTVKQLKRKECLRKQCKWLSKYKHEYWDEREKIKALRKQRKEQQK
jgi:hypothetical protein